MKVLFIFDAFGPEIKSVPSKPGTECYPSQCPAFSNGAGRQRSKDKCASGKRKQHLMFEIGETIVRDQLPVFHAGTQYQSEIPIRRRYLTAVAVRIAGVSSGQRQQASQAGQLLWI
jgi:hypothetical protein